jgi:translation elongation factor EF-1alpha
VVEIEKHGEKSSFCEPGDNVKIKIGGVDDWEQIEPGFMLCPVKHPIPHSTTIDAEVSCACDSLAQ